MEKFKIEIIKNRGVTYVATSSKFFVIFKFLISFYLINQIKSKNKLIIKISNSQFYQEIKIEIIKKPRCYCRSNIL